MARHGSCVAVRIGRSVPAFQAHLMASEFAEINKKTRVELHAALGIRVNLYHPTPDAFRVELRVPRRVERVCEVNTAAITADLHHLRSTVERRACPLGMRCA